MLGALRTAAVSRVAIRVRAPFFDTVHCLKKRRRSRPVALTPLMSRN